jgi:hypothetical protein
MGGIFYVDFVVFLQPLVVCGIYLNAQPVGGMNVAMVGAGMCHIQFAGDVGNFNGFAFSAHIFLQ